MKRPIIVAEIGINHNGDIDLAKQMMDIAHISGCDYVKFQKRTISTVYSQDELNQYRESPWGSTNREQKEGLEFGKPEYDEIDKHSKALDLPWFASPWDIASVDFLMDYKPPFIKVASPSLTNDNLLAYIRQTGVPLILSTGMCTEDELYHAIDILGINNIEHILHCTSSYPTPVEDMNMQAINTLKQKFGSTSQIGFSNHSSSILFMIMAATMNVGMIEFHITLDRAMYGSDQAASIETSGVFRLCKYIQSIEQCWGHGRIDILDSEVPVRKKLVKKVCK